MVSRPPKLAKAQAPEVIIASAARQGESRRPKSAPPVSSTTSPTTTASSICSRLRPVDHVVVSAAQLKSGPSRRVDGRRALDHGRQVLGAWRVARAADIRAAVR